MEWTIPGTVIQADKDNHHMAELQIRSMFLTGGIMRSQVVAATGLKAHAVQNWVQRGFVSSPVNKRYTLRQFCRILIINMLKGSMPMDKICGLLYYINGQLDDESDDLIDDSQLYFAFLKAACSYTGRMENEQQLKTCIGQCLKDYQTPSLQAKERVEQVLHIMLLCWADTRLQQKTQSLLNNIQ